MKTEDDISREKDAVQKMIGAKGAMETALKRIDRLESTIRAMLTISDDAAGKVGEHLYVKTYHHGKGSDLQVVTLKEQLQRISSIGRNVM